MSKINNNYNLISYMEHINWSVVHTGGNCYAFKYSTSDYQEVMITHKNGLSIVKHLDEEILIGFYNYNEDHTNWDDEYWEGITLREFLEMWY